MTSAQQEIYDRCKARAAAGWHSGFLARYEGEDLRIAKEGHRDGRIERIRQAAREEERRTQPIYSRRGM